jgi:Ca2+-binding RTX toxin-like protein
MAYAVQLRRSPHPITSDPEFLSMATAAQVQALYLAYFGRPADPEGLAYWTTANASATQAQVADAFAATPEYKASIAGKTTAQIVEDYYLRLFNRTSDSAGLTYWVNQINTGALTTQSVGLALVTAAQSQTNTPDSISVASKLTGADQFTAEVAKSSAGILAYSGVNGLAAGRSFLAPVNTTATIPTAAQTTAAVNLLIATNGGGSTETLALSIFPDVFTTSTGVRIIGGTSEQVPFRFTSSNQVVNASAGTITNSPAPTISDTLVDPSNLDNDTINIGPGNYVNTFVATSAVRFSNIETINFTFANDAVTGNNISFVTATNTPSFATGAKKIALAGSLAAPTTFTGFGESGATTFDGSALASNAANGIIVTSYAGPNIAATNPILTITGSSSNDQLTGGGGDDMIKGGAGIDFIFGLGGADTLNGEAGGDNITGGEGNDTINSGAGSDIVTGSNGKDTFIYDSLASDFVDLNADGITDFTQGTGVNSDVLRLSASAFTGLTAGAAVTYTTRVGASNAATNVIVDTFAQIQLATGADALSNTRLAYDTTGNRWLYDANGDWGSGSLVFANSLNALTLAGLSPQNIPVV